MENDPNQSGKLRSVKNSLASIIAYDDTAFELCSLAKEIPLIEERDRPFG
jgi:hypothetical protein